MDISIRDRFTALWGQYFPGADLPVAIEFRDDTGDGQPVPRPDGWRCLVCQAGRARNGTPLLFDDQSITCAGGLMYAGYSHERPPQFRDFLSKGKVGVIEGERYKQTPDVVDAWERRIPPFPPHGKYLLMKRWDTLSGSDNPGVVVFFARPEVVSGLFTLANYDRGDPDGVICPMGAGCSSILLYPWLEQHKDDPKVVMGMFDPSARKCVALDIMTISFPMKKFAKVIGYMDESFLITKTWDTVKKKIGMSASLYRKE
jgi:uncharacterized protein (DUF169 family)